MKKRIHFHFILAVLLLGTMPVEAAPVTTEMTLIANEKEAVDEELTEQEESNVIFFNTDSFTKGNSKAREKARAKAFIDAINDGYSIRLTGRNQVILRDAVTIDLARDGQFIEGEIRRYESEVIPDDDKLTYRNLSHVPIIGLNSGSIIRFTGANNRLKGIKILNHGFENFDGSPRYRSFSEAPACIELSPDASDAEIIGVHVTCQFTALLSRGVIQNSLTIKGSYFFSQWTTPIIYNLAGLSPSEQPILERKRRSNALMCPPATESTTTDLQTTTPLQTEQPTSTAGLMTASPQTIELATTESPTEVPPANDASILISRTLIANRADFGTLRNIDLSSFGPLYNPGEVDNALLGSGLFIRGAANVEIRKSLVLAFNFEGGGINLRNIQKFNFKNSEVFGDAVKIRLRDSFGQMTGMLFVVENGGGAPVVFEDNSEMRTDPRDANGVVIPRRVNRYFNVDNLPPSGVCNRGSSRLPVTADVYILGRNNQLMDCGGDDEDLRAAMVNYAASLTEPVKPSALSRLHTDQTLERFGAAK